MNRAQIERAEKAAEALQDRRVLTQFRRMDVEAARRELIKRMVENTDDEMAKVQERLLAYGEQARRFEQYRQEAAVFLIEQGVVKDDPSWRASEAPVKKRKHPTKFSEMRFTDEQLAIAKRSLSQPVFSRYDGF